MPRRKKQRSKQQGSSREASFLLLVECPRWRAFLIGAAVKASWHLRTFLGVRVARGRDVCFGVHEQRCESGLPLREISALAVVLPHRNHGGAGDNSLRNVSSNALTRAVC